MWSVNNIKNWVKQLTILSTILLFAACDAEEIITLGPLEIDDVTGDAIYCSVEVSGEMPFDCGFCYATTKIGAESLTASKVKGTYGLRDISGVIDGLESNTTYFVRGYAMTIRGKVYTETVSVKTTIRIPQADDNKYPEIEYK